MLDELPDKTTPGAEAPAASTPVTLDLIAIGFLRDGLFDKAYTRLWGARDTLSDAQIHGGARQFASVGDLRSSLYFVGAESRRRR